MIVRVTSISEQDGCNAASAGEQWYYIWAFGKWKSNRNASQNCPSKFTHVDSRLPSHLTIQSQRFPSHRYNVCWKLSRHGLLAVTSSVCDSNGTRGLYLSTVTNLIYAGCIPRFQGSNAPLSACLKYNSAISWRYYVASSCHVWRLHHAFQTHSLLLLGVLSSVQIRPIKVVFNEIKSLPSKCVLNREGITV